MTDVCHEPPQLTIGQATESWDHLRRFLADEAREPVRELVWLREVFRVLGMTAFRH